MVFNSLTLSSFTQTNTITNPYGCLPSKNCKKRNFDANVCLLTVIWEIGRDILVVNMILIVVVWLQKTSVTILLLELNSSGHCMFSFNGKEQHGILCSIIEWMTHRFRTSVNDGRINFSFKKSKAMMPYLCHLLSFFMVRHGAHRQLTSTRRFTGVKGQPPPKQTIWTASHCDITSWEKRWGRSNWLLLPELMDLLFAQTMVLNKGDECLLQCLHFQDGGDLNWHNRREVFFCSLKLCLQWKLNMHAVCMFVLYVTKSRLYSGYFMISHSDCCSVSFMRFLLLVFILCLLFVVHKSLAMIVLLYSTWRQKWCSAG